jgi:hypothetical protein
MHIPHIEHCPTCKQYVRMDQTQEECAREHQCHTSNCPMKGYFHFVPAPTGEAPEPAAAGTPRK